MKSMKYVAPIFALIMSTIAVVLIVKHDRRASATRVMSSFDTPILVVPKRVKTAKEIFSATACKATGNVFFHKRVDKKSKRAHLEVAVQYHMRSRERRQQMFTFTCVLRWGDNMHRSRKKSTSMIIRNAERAMGGLLFELPWGGKSDTGVYKYSYNCSCVWRSMEGLRIVDSSFKPPE